jgi:thiol-disulfide isomerase/thioredoxin
VAEGAQHPPSIAAIQAKHGAKPLPYPRPAFTLPDIHGKKHSISEWDGKLILLNFWASWCAPCRREVPLLVKLQKKYGSQGLQVIGLALDQPKPVRDFIQHYAINYPVLVGTDKVADVGDAYGDMIGVIPFSVLIGRKGRILARHTGELHRKQALGWIKRLSPRNRH